MAARTLDITIEQGATFTLAPQTFGSRSFSGCTFRAEIRKTQSTGADRLAVVTSEDDDGGISASGAIVSMVVPDEITAAIARDGFWDMKCYNTDGTVDRLLEGVVTVSKAVTTEPTA